MNAIAWLITMMCGIFSRFPRRRRIALLSRQSRNPLDFRVIEPYLRSAFPNHRIVRCTVRKGGRLGVVTMLEQLWLSATSALCIVDGYVPAVSIPRNHDRLRSELPPCVQMWHALGAVKKFGYQSLDTPAGRSSKAARTLAMHRGYAFVISGFAGTVHDFAAAFGYDSADIRPLGLPRADYLLRPEYAERRRLNVAATRRHLELSDAVLRNHTVVLYAPTFRRNAADGQWHRHYIEALYESLPEDAILVVSGHPLDDMHETWLEGKARLRFLRSVASIDALPFADYVVTDYSAVAFESMLLRRPTMFYVPDIDEYRASPGLNIDPEFALPTVTFRDARRLGRYIARDRVEHCYDAVAMRTFCEAYGITAVRESATSSCERIIRALAPMVDEPLAETAATWGHAAAATPTPARVPVTTVAAASL
ncbi:CDP-glycerol glycerophosphotransferase family protein [Bifidobacterium sp. 82T24]|uniref:CDP-glycerol glycerophosphotransferase family protein n=1 Tax=Bifidobacterium pluvialisilvae TaxID=2834436 RepID=UPI001C59AE97|nr:CDP-glycerol glycerophosphotransferase family protein [Bifidobacterium pluvialisilvae]MBW3088447.1 CDP-glycerol glycerophosphotransferase family protein [Bifidobacterium pluvialisilvae]